MSWQQRVREAQAEREKGLKRVKPEVLQWSNILPQCSLTLPSDVLTSREISLTEDYRVSDLLAKLRSKEISAEEVTRAFLRRAWVAQAAVS